VSTARRRLRSAALLACACFAVATPAAANYFVVARAGVTALNGTCSDDDDSGVLVATSASAAATCPTGTAEASVDLATASMRLFATADSAPSADVVSTARGEIQDVLRFQVPPAMQGEPFALQVQFVLDGEISPDALPYLPYFTVLLSSRCTLTDFSNFDQFDALVTDLAPIGVPRIRGGTISITPPDYAMNVSLQMLAPGLKEGTIDFLSTAELRLAAPEGVTYTSDSGVFQAPEPGAAAIGWAAIAALALLRRR